MSTLDLVRSLTYETMVRLMERLMDNTSELTICELEVCGYIAAIESHGDRMLAMADQLGIVLDDGHGRRIYTNTQLACKIASFRRINHA